MNNPNDIIIGITGRRGSGKDSAANIFLKEFLTTHHVIKMGFADSVKDDICEIFGITREKLEVIKNNTIVRHLLQWYGTDFTRKKDPNYWVKEIEYRISKLEKLEVPYFIIIPDVRFQNELDWIKSNGGTTFNIARGQSNQQELKLGEVDNHESETNCDILPVDFHILNYQTLKYLEFEVKMHCSMLKLKYGIPQ
jgi:hypothetical protein